MQKQNILLRVPNGLLLFIQTPEDSSLFLQTSEGTKYLTELQRIEYGIITLNEKGLDCLSPSEQNLLNFYHRRQHELIERIGAQLPYPSPTARA